ncbi:glutaminase domain-containing protein [Bacteroides thetaiotaomicron]|uniref:glutaminase domain-containing protein n=1 Tax=Bacteroides thetaiotaomicron TaxID=818 RepID=UPI0035B27B8A
MQKSTRYLIAKGSLFHKLLTDKEGNLLWFSKENNSNGLCKYSRPNLSIRNHYFRVYNPELQKAMMTSIFEYSASGRWNKPSQHTI